MKIPPNPKDENGDQKLVCQSAFFGERNRLLNKCFNSQTLEESSLIYSNGNLRIHRHERERIFFEAVYVYLAHLVSTP